jgi:hypothetical protein
MALPVSTSPFFRKRLNCPNTSAFCETLPTAA